jgi:predicted nuclease of predicted toxin-antitoxin system
MKLYLDENLSPRFRHQLDAQLFQVFTYQFMGWQGKKNGELLSLLVENNFRGIITSDQLMYTDILTKRSAQKQSLPMVL